jgi:hypothetical protein
MNRSIALGLLAVGVVLLIFGVQASDSVSSQISKAFSGAPTDKAIWLIGLGVLSAAAGLMGLIRTKS